MMAMPAVKKQKVDQPKSPIVFSTPGLPPDISLKVFDQEFHAHSALLKIHSIFFRKFLDSAEKDDRTSAAASSASALTKFRYKWVTSIDVDGDWHLVDGTKLKVCFFPRSVPFECVNC